MSVRTRYVYPLPVVFAIAILTVAGCSSTSDSSTEPTSTTVASPELQDCTKDGLGFTGGATVPRQIFGSYGPGTSQVWDVATQTAGGDTQNVQMATGMPNGVVTILWGENAGAGNNTLTVECTTGWGTYAPDDPTKLWHAGIIFNNIPGLGENTYFCHHIEMDVQGDTVTMNMWETYWSFGENYSCPTTLKEALDGAITFPNPITYLSLPSTGIGATPVPPADWTTDGTQVGVRLS